MFSTIVVGFDSSERSFDALALARALAGAETELVVCCVHPPDLPDRRSPAEPVADEARERVQTARGPLGDRPRTRYEVRAAFSPGAGLHAEAEESGADLLVVGSSHRSAIGRVVLGSVTRQALGAAPCAVAVAPAGLHAHAEVPVGEIGVAFTDAPESRAALQTAAALARERGARLRVLSVVDPTASGVGWASAWVYADVRDDMRRIAEENCKEALATLEGVEASSEVIDGFTAQELVLASSRLDLLVMGSRGYGPVRRTLLGTVSGRVAEAAACPVLVVPRIHEQEG